MKVWKIIVFLLILALLGTNGWWFYRVLDAAATKKYDDLTMYQRASELKQLMSMVPELCSDKSKNEIVAIARKSEDTEPFEKEGAVWVGWFGFQFNDKNKLVKVIPLIE
jgi:hypothetical protein